MGRRLVHLQVGWPLGADVQRWSPDGQWPLRDELLTSVPLIDPVAAKSARVHVDCAAVFGSRLAAGAEAAASGCARTPRDRRERPAALSQPGLWAPAFSDPLSILPTQSQALYPGRFPPLRPT